MIQSRGYETAFLDFGIGQGLLVFLLGWLLRSPPKRRGEFEAMMQARAGEARTRVPDYTPWRMLATPVFWVLYLMFVMMASGGLMATAQLGPIASDFHIANTPVSLAGLTLPALTFALSIDRFLNGVTRPFFGWISDKIGRETTMFVAFGLEGAGIILLSQFGRDPVAFVILTGLVFFAWGEIYSLFPATCGDSFGSRHAAANAGLLYTAKGTAALLVPLTSILAAQGGWNIVFWVAAALNIAAAIMALAILKPLRARMRARI
jgi:OFA family oxalate/formate antiporter-like MFS transporter